MADDLQLLGHGRSMPSVRDVARVAGVSLETVSRVVNGSPPVEPETAPRIRAATNQPGYRPTQEARHLTEMRSDAYDDSGSSDEQGVTPDEDRAKVNAIVAGRTALGVELGSTRIKAVLTGPDHAPLATGGHDWENQLVDGLWTYHLDDVWAGLQGAYAALARDVEKRYGIELTTVGALGISAMMHGYLAFDADNKPLVPFRTWRNTNTDNAARQLSAAFDHNIPHRWSVAHLYQAVLDHEPHLPRLAHLTTLAGYVHWQLTGQQVIGVGDASGMFPIDGTTRNYDTKLLEKFDTLARQAGTQLALADLLPTVLLAGQPAGKLTDEGARRLDPTGRLRAGVQMCPPEGDAGTGMVATSAVAPRTGNVSAGTSIFAMVVLDTALQRPHREVDLVTTPAGDLVAMVHCNNGASELDGWARLFGQFARALDVPADPARVFATLFTAALGGAVDGGGMVAFNYLAGEPITGLHEGRPLFLRTPGSPLDLGTFVRAQLYSALATLRLGMDVLQKEESVGLDVMFAHGGLFKTEGVADRFLAAAIDVPVAVGRTAGEGGAWGAAVLAAYAREGTRASLADYLETRVFGDAERRVTEPDPADVAGFDAFMKRYTRALPIEHAAVHHA